MPILISLLTALVIQSPSYTATVEKLRGERVAELKSDGGWLTVAGLFWLKAGDNTAGSASSNALVLPKAAPAQLGVVALADGRVTFKVAPGTVVTTNGQPVTTTVLDARLTISRRSRRG